MFFPITNKTTFAIIEEATRQARKKDGQKLPCFTRILIEIRGDANTEDKSVHVDDIAERVSELIYDGHLEKITHKGYTGYRIASIPEDDHKKLTKEKLFSFILKVADKDVIANIQGRYEGRIVGESKFNNYFGFSWAEKTALIENEHLSFEDKKKVGGFLRNLIKEDKICEMLWKNLVLYRPGKHIDYNMDWWRHTLKEQAQHRTLPETKYQAVNVEDVFDFIKETKPGHKRAYPFFGWCWVEHEDVTTNYRSDGNKEQVEVWLQELVDDHRLSRLKYKSRIYYHNI